MKKEYKPVDLASTRTRPAESRQTRVSVSSFMKPVQKGASFLDFYDSLPGFLAVDSLRKVVDAVVSAHRRQRPVVIGTGAHLIKVGLSRLVIDLMERGVVSCVALNGAGAIHDFEIATLGGTSEDVGKGLDDGLFGMVEETTRDMNRAMSRVGDGRNEAGLGRLLGEWLLDADAPHRDQSILACGALHNVPVTVHVAVGTDTIHLSKHVNPAALGEATFTDFRLFASVVCDLEGGVYLNIGSAVILPEVFLKAFALARNLGHGLADFTTVNMDMQQHFRPLHNVLSRPGGTSFALTGHHEIMIPILYQALMESL